MRNFSFFGIVATVLLSYSSLDASACDLCACDSEEPQTKTLYSYQNPFYEDWSQGVLPNKWYLYRKIFGTGNNGVVPDLVTLEQDVVDGVTKNVLVLKGQGNLTNSTILGVKKSKGKYVTGNSPQRVGSAVTTVNYFSSGTYEVRMKIGSPNSAPCSAPVGLSPTIFTFHYEEHYAANKDLNGTKLNSQDPQYQPRLKQGNRNTGYYSTVNSEIDCPEFGRNGDFNTPAFVTYTSELLSSTINVDLSQYAINVLDGNYHSYRTIWKTDLIPTTLQDFQVRSQGAYFYAYDSATSPIQGYPVVKSYGIWYMYTGKSATLFIDGSEVGQITQTISPISARLTLLSWFPSWAGVPNWDETKVYISEVSIIPCEEPGDVTQEPESYPLDGLVPPPRRLYIL